MREEWMARKNVCRPNFSPNFAWLFLACLAGCWCAGLPAFCLLVLTQPKTRFRKFPYVMMRDQEPRITLQFTADNWNGRGETYSEQRKKNDSTGIKKTQRKWSSTEDHHRPCLFPPRAMKKKIFPLIYQTASLARYRAWKTISHIVDCSYLSTLPLFLPVCAYLLYLSFSDH